MKFSDLRKCDFCEHPVSGKTRAGNAIDFHRLVVEHLILNMQAINERMGLTLMLGGSEQLADVMGSQQEAALPVYRVELLICSPCWGERGFDALRDLDGKGKQLPTPETERAIGART